MGKKTGPAPPPAPDPNVVSAAQTASNVATATANANLNRIDQYTPYGNLTYQVVGTNADGTPKYQQTQTFSDSQQQQFDQYNSLSNALLGFGQNELATVQNTTQNPLSFDGLTPMQGGVNAGSMQMGIDVPDYASFIDPAGHIQRNVANAGPIAQGGAPAGPITNNITGAGPIASGYGSGGNIQAGLDYSGLSALPGTGDFSADRQRAEDAAYQSQVSRLDPQFASQQHATEARLANMGVARGSAAWNQEIDSLNRSRTDAYGQARNDAVQQGSAEQSRLFGLAMGARQEGVNEIGTAGQFANQAQQQDYGQQFDRGQFYNSAQAQQYAQNANDANFQNQAQNQQYGQNMSDAAFFNQAQQQQYGQNATDMQAHNQAQNQQYTQNASDAAFYNDSSDRIFGTDLAARTFANQAQNQSYTQQANNVSLNNSARQQQEQELAYLHSAPINELATIMGTAGSVQQPQFSSVPGVNMANTDTSGNAYSSYQGNYNAWQSQQQARSQMLGGIFGLLGTAASMAPSDRRIKERIERIGETAQGIATYVFSYIGDKARQFGVMAQEVLHIPGAVETRNGIMHVNYGKVW